MGLCAVVAPSRAVGLTCPRVKLPAALGTDMDLAWPSSFNQSGSINLARCHG